MYQIALFVSWLVVAARREASSIGQLMAGDIVVVVIVVVAVGMKTLCHAGVVVFVQARFSIGHEGRRAMDDEMQNLVVLVHFRKRGSSTYSSLHYNNTNAIPNNKAGRLGTYESHHSSFPSLP